MVDLLASMEQSQQNQTIATQQLASARDVNQLSDNPAAAAALVLNHNQSAQDAQYLQNQGTLQTKFQTADSTLSSAVQLMTRAVSLGVEGATGTMNAANQQAIGGEVQGILSQMLSLANTSYQGAYLFSGTAVNTQPFTQTAGGIVYNGNAAVTSVQIGNGETITANVPGSTIFMNPAGNVLGALQDLSTALNSGTGIPAAVTEVENGLNQLNIQRIPYGNALNQLNSSEVFLNQDTINLSSQENALAGADMSVAATHFAEAQLANQGTIAATSQLLNRKTLLDYIA